MNGRIRWLPAAIATMMLLACARPVLAQTALPTQPALSRDQLAPRWQWLVDYTIAQNEVWRVLALVAALIVAVVAGRLIRAVLNFIAAGWKVRGHRLPAVALEAVARSVVALVIVLGLQLGLQFLVLNPAVAQASSAVTSVLMTMAWGFVAYSLVTVVDQWLSGISERTPSKLDDMLVPLVRKTLKTTIFVLVLVQIITVLSDKPATSIIAGLGVGGLAVGLAAQDTIKNVFGSMMIFGDRPFELGDEITVDNLTGSVETVGFRSTRFRTGDGHLVTIPNGELASKTIVNVSKRPFLVRRLNLALPYDLPPEKTEQALAIVRDILANHDGQQPANPPRVFLNDISSTALNLLVHYWYYPAKWWDFIALNERVNLEVLKRFREAEIPLAYPTQLVKLDEQREGEDVENENQDNS